MAAHSKRQTGFRPPGSRGPRSSFTGRTGPLLSRSQIQERAKQEFARARRYGYPLCLAAARVDRVEHLADLYGHEARQLLMDALAHVFKTRVRGTDLVGRLGEDRVLWLMPHTPVETAIHAAERLRAAACEFELESGNRKLRVTLSVGLACYEQRNSLFFDSVLQQAERALERAERLGGNACEVYTKPRPGSRS